MNYTLGDLRFGLVDKLSNLKGIVRYKKKKQDDLKIIIANNNEFFTDIADFLDIDIDDLTEFQKIELYNKYNHKATIFKLDRKDLINVYKFHKIVITDDIKGIAPKANTSIYNVIKVKGKKIKQYTESQQQEQHHNLIKINPFKVSKNDIDLDLSIEQKKFVTSFALSNHNAIAIWGVGTGKTVLAAMCALEFLAINPDKDVVFITPASLQTNMLLTLHSLQTTDINGKKTYIDIQDKRFNFYSFEKYMRKAPECKDCLVIIDEAHNLRGQINLNPTEAGGMLHSNKRGGSILLKTTKANKILLMTATPFVNTVYDIESLMTILNKVSTGSMPKGSFFAMLNEKQQLEDYFECKLSINLKPNDPEFFPKKTEHLLFVELDEQAENIYNLIKNSPPLEEIQRKLKKLKVSKELIKKILLEIEVTKDPDDDSDETHLQSFHNGVRRIINLIENSNGINPKIDAIIKQIKTYKHTKNRKPRFIIYYSFIDAGLNLMKKELEKAGLDFLSVSGANSIAQKQKATTEYNNGNIDVLLISKSGAEGLDLKQTTAVFIVDNPWNEATNTQIIGRGVRYKSHFGLAKKYWNVDVFRLMIYMKSEHKFIRQLSDLVKNDSLKDDLYLLMVVLTRKQKNNNNIVFRDEVQKALLKNNIRELTQKYNNGDISKRELEAGKKQLTSTSWKDITLNRYPSQEDFERKFGLINITFPSIDIMLFLMSKMKQHTINQFVSILDKIHRFEDSECLNNTDELFIKKIVDWNKKHKKEITDDIKLQIYSDIIKSKKNDANHILDTANILKKKSKILQQYYTPVTVIDNMIKISNIEDDERLELNILEPTAGTGNIIQHINQKLDGNKFKINWKVGEYDKKNRILLTKYFNKYYKNNDDETHILFNNRNFLDTVTSLTFDYIFMNPPFHLVHTNYDIYDHDVYDIDFVFHAFKMLNPGGRLVAIIDARRIDLEFKTLKTNNSRLQKVINDLEVYENYEINGNNIKRIEVKRGHFINEKGDKISLKIGYLYLYRSIKRTRISRRKN